MLGSVLQTITSLFWLLQSNTHETGELRAHLPLTSLLWVLSPSSHLPFRPTEPGSPGGPGGPGSPTAPKK